MNFALVAIINILPAALGAYLSIMIANRFSRSVAERGSKDWRYLLAVLIVFPVMILIGFVLESDLVAKLSKNGPSFPWLNALAYACILIAFCLFTKEGAGLVANISRYAKRSK